MDGCVQEKHFALGSTGFLSLWDLGESDGLSEEVLELLEDWVSSMEEQAGVDVERDTSTLKAYSASGGDVEEGDVMSMCAVFFHGRHTWQIGYSMMLEGLEDEDGDEDIDPHDEVETILKVLDDLANVKEN